MKFERRHEQLLPGKAFFFRMVRFALLSGAIISGSLVLGIVGYMTIGDLGLVDAILDASFILTGMGPVHEMKTTAAKLFASAYALFSGVIFITSVGVLLAPAFHRILHHFHLELDEESGRRRAEH